MIAERGARRMRRRRLRRHRRHHRADDETPTGDSGAQAGYTIVQRFPQAVQVAGALRLPISLSTSDAVLVQDGPATLEAQVRDIDGQPVGERIQAARRDAVPAPYYDFRPTIETPGIYALVVDGGPPRGATFDVAEPGSVTVPPLGDPLPPFDTPTTDDAGGVDPICTRARHCPFHDVTLTEALGGRQARRLLRRHAGVLRHRQLRTGLESIIEVQTEFGRRFSFVHAEVYADMTATTLAPAVRHSRRSGSATSRCCSSPTPPAWCRADRRGVEHRGSCEALTRAVS